MGTTIEDGEKLGTAIEDGEKTAYVEGAASGTGETHPRWIRHFHWRYGV